MKQSVIATSVGLPFLVTVVGVGFVALLGSCGDATTCAAKGFVVGPIILIAVPITGFIAGRVSSSSLVGVVAVLAAAGLVVGFIEIEGLWYRAPDPDGQGSEVGIWLFLTGLAVVLMLPGFLIGRSRHEGEEIAKLDAQRDAGLISSNEYRRLTRYTAEGARQSGTAWPSMWAVRQAPQPDLAWEVSPLRCQLRGVPASPEDVPAGTMTQAAGSSTAAKRHAPIRPVTARSHHGDETDREDAWDAAHEALPAGRHVGPVTSAPAIPGYGHLTDAMLGRAADRTDVILGPRAVETA